MNRFILAVFMTAVAAPGFGHQQTCQVDLAATDVRVQIDRTAHDDPAGNIEFLDRPLAVGRRGNDASVAPIEVSHRAIDPICRVVDGSTTELRKHRSGASRRHHTAAAICATTLATDGSDESTSPRRRTATTLSPR